MSEREHASVPIAPPPRVFHVALQPTTLCNLDCRYCYLPLRKSTRTMPVAVAESVAAALVNAGGPIRLVWHSGEPLACGVEHFRSLIAPFGPRTEGVLSHSLQTNATLLSEPWCDLFDEYGIEVGISIDGTPAMNVDRRDWSGKSVDARVTRGANLLHRRRIPFAIISVVTRDRLDEAEALYKFACELGCTILCINIEETEGVNVASRLPQDAIRHFWRDLYDSWAKNPVIPIREFDRPLRLMLDVCDSDSLPPPVSMEMFPCVAVDGSVVFLSPELVDSAPQLIAGNVLETPLFEIVARARSLSYVSDYQVGLHRCRDTCQYFSVCGGGAASNRYFEQGRFDISETECCRNRLKSAVDVLLDRLTTSREATNAETV
ncbi:MAG: putative arylsulfatase regulatory protein [Gemmatimonadetes bacterium]|nr:putative arylsulfatase regulatory protein [Gemmatimonadota bacterium]